MATNRSDALLIKEDELRELQQLQQKPKKRAVLERKAAPISSLEKHLDMCWNVQDHARDILNRNKHIFSRDSHVVVWSWHVPSELQKLNPDALLKYIMVVADIALPTFLPKDGVYWTCYKCDFIRWANLNVQTLQKHYDAKRIAAWRVRASEYSDDTYVLFPPGFSESKRQPVVNTIEWDEELYKMPGAVYASLNRTEWKVRLVYVPPFVYRLLTKRIFPFLTFDASRDSDPPAVGMAVAVDSRNHIGMMTMKQESSTSLTINVFDSGGNTPNNHAVALCVLELVPDTDRVYESNVELQLAWEDMHCQTWIWYFAYCYFMRGESLMQFTDRMVKRSPDCRLVIVRRFREMIQTSVKGALMPWALQWLKNTEQAPNDEVCIYGNIESKTSDDVKDDKKKEALAAVPAVHHIRIIQIVNKRALQPPVPPAPVVVPSSPSDKENVDPNAVLEKEFEALTIDTKKQKTWWEEGLDGWPSESLSYIQKLCNGTDWHDRSGMLVAKVVGMSHTVLGLLLYDTFVQNNVQKTDIVQVCLNTGSKTGNREVERRLVSFLLLTVQSKVIYAHPKTKGEEELLEMFGFQTTRDSAGQFMLLQL